MANIKNFIQSKKTLILSITILLISIIFGYTYFLSRLFVRRTDPLPCIWPAQLNSTLYEYIKTLPSRHIYVLAGPLKTGKSTLLTNLTNELRQRNRLVFNFDYKKAKSLHDVQGFTQLAIFEALKFFNNPSIYQSISPVDVENSFSVNTFLDSLENLQGIATPIIIIQGVGQLQKVAPQMYEIGLSRFSRRNQYNDNIPVIIETRNSLFRNKYIPSFFRIIEIDEIEDPYKTLSKNLHAFSSSEIKKIKASIGFQGGPINNIFQEVKKSNNIDNAILKEINHINKKVLKYRTNGTIIQRLCDTKEKPILIGKGDLDTIIPLLNKGLVYITNEYKLKASNHAVWKSLCA